MPTTLTMPDVAESVVEAQALGAFALEVDVRQRGHEDVGRPGATPVLLASGGGEAFGAQHGC